MKLKIYLTIYFQYFMWAKKKHFLLLSDENEEKNGKLCRNTFYSLWIKMPKFELKLKQFSLGMQNICLKKN